MAPQPKLTIAQIGNAKARLAADPSLTHLILATEYGVHESTLSRALAAQKKPEVPQAPDGHHPITMLPLDLLFPSPFNPRKTFDDTAIAELAENIAANGLLQNLIVRAANENNLHEIIAGERRYRALRLLQSQGRWPGPVMCQIRTADNNAHLVLAIIENLQRVDVPPLEEADGFAQLQALDPKTWTTAAIATAVNRTTRFVQQRLSLAVKLAPPVRAALASGKINIEAARMLGTASVQVQEDIIKRRNGDLRPDDIMWELRGTLFDASDAIFDIEASGLATFEAHGDTFIEDRAAAVELQKLAIKQKAEELRKQWHFVKTLKPGEQFNTWLWQDKKTKAQGGGAVIAVNNDYSVRIFTGLIKKPEAPAARQPKPYDPNAYAAAQEKADAKRAEIDRARIATMQAVTIQKPSDYTAAEQEEMAKTGHMNLPADQKSCANECQFRVWLESLHHYDGWLVCTNPASDRAGLLTHEYQAGRTCFTPITKGKAA
jgi:ParB/RepB/Spo0J family partition protein